MRPPGGGTYPQALGALVFAGKGAGRNGSKNETWGSVYKKDFEPRVGFRLGARHVFYKDVIRGSGGIYYGPLVYADYGQGTVQGFTVQGNLFTADPLDGLPLDSRAWPHWPRRPTSTRINWMAPPSVRIT